MIKNLINTKKKGSNNNKNGKDFEDIPFGAGDE
jgi:hypothetical protein